MQAGDYRFYVSFPPHILGVKSVGTIIYSNLIALVPAIIAALYYFRGAALKVMALAVITTVLCEAGMQKFLKRDITISDGHAVLSGLLFAFLLSPVVPWWLVVVGSGTGIVVGKMIFGELGNNPFNPPLVGLVMVRLSFPDQISDWVEPAGGWVPDPPLRVFKFDGLEAFNDYGYELFDLFIGQQAGGIGTACGVALLAGGIYLILRRIISWQIPVGLLGTVFIFSGILWLADKGANLHPLFHLVTGGTLLGAFFLATDPVTSPVTRWGKLAYGIICGLLIMIIRAWGAYPDGVAFAILLANTSAPLINKVRPRPYGKEKGVA
jgi:electron transport complex protein RnfD